MDSITQQLKAYIEAQPFASGASDCKTVLDQQNKQYHANQESNDPFHRISGMASVNWMTC